MNTLVARSRARASNRLLCGVDGRKASARRFRDLCRAYEAEVAGDLTESAHGLIRQAALLTLTSERLQRDIARGVPVDTDEVIKLSAEIRAILSGIGHKAGINAGST